MPGCGAEPCWGRGAKPPETPCRRALLGSRGAKPPETPCRRALLGSRGEAPRNTVQTTPPGVERGEAPGYPYGSESASAAVNAPSANPRAYSQVM
jgi:hypothetical protein